MKRSTYAATVLLLGWSLVVYAGDLRAMAYTPGTKEAAQAWQIEVRAGLFDALHMRDLVAQDAPPIPFDTEKTGYGPCDGYRMLEIRFRSTPTRFIDACLAIPDQPEGKLPAVVCVHGHGGDRFTAFDPEAAIYKQFGAALARRGYVVISIDVGQHEVYEEGRTLMGERLWDLMRCVDYLAAMDRVDARRIGCAGLSLGGEMTMWLGAMDTRVAATSSCGFLTLMDQMEQNHCMCWKFDGLRERVDFPDIYALVAPRALQCQNGRKEPETQFNIGLAEVAFDQVLPIYRDMEAGGEAELVIHDGGHEIAIESLTRFFDEHLAP